MTTPKQNTGLTASEWKARYAEIAPHYVGGNQQPARRILLPHERERVRQWEELTYRLSSPAGYGIPNIRIPTDPDFAFRGIFCFVAGLPLTKT